MQWLSNHTKSLQDRFAEYCRTGQTVALPGTSAGRMKHYRRLSFNVISNALEQAYPITLEVLTDDDWITLVDGFYANHKSRTPLLWQMPYEFYEYVENNELPVKKTFPFLPELLYFEWLEIEVHTMEDLDLPEKFIARSSFGMEEKIAVNPEYQLVQLTHPLHIMPVKEAVRHPGNYYALIYRDPGNGNVRFINLSALFAYAFDQLAQQPVSMMQVAQRTEKAFRLTKDHKVASHLSAFIHDLAQQKTVLGVVS